MPVQFWLRPGIHSDDLSSIRLSPSSARLLTGYGRELRVLEPQRVQPLEILTNVLDAQWLSETRFVAIQRYRDSELNLYNSNGEKISTVITFPRDRATFALHPFAHSNHLVISGNNDGTPFSFDLTAAGTLSPLPSDQRHLFCRSSIVSTVLNRSAAKIYMNGTELLPLAPTDHILSGISCSDRYLLVAYTNPKSLDKTIRAYDFASHRPQSLHLPPHSFVNLLEQSLTSPHAVSFIIHTLGGRPIISAFDGVFPKLSLPHTDAETHFVPTSDGEAVPVTILPGKRSKKHPAILVAYGAYGESLDYSPRPELLALQARGFDVVFTEVRGGGASLKGQRWADAGKGPQKERGIEDLVTAAKYLKSARAVTQLIGMGKSAGGLLMLAAAIKHPEVFDGIVVENPIINLASAVTEGVAPYAKIEAEEWGDRDAPLIAKLSPLALPLPQSLPPIAIFVGLNDDLLPPAEAFKFVRKLRTEDHFAALLATQFADHGGQANSSDNARTLAQKVAIVEELLERGRQ